MIAVEAPCRRDRQGRRRSNRYPVRILDFLNNRHYDPTTGVFLSVDPLVAETGFPYVYGDANPVTKSDPGGLCTSFSVDADGNWTCTFYTPDDGERSVDNHGDGFCNEGYNICSVDEGELPRDFVFGDSKPEQYEGVPTGVLDFDPGPDPGQWLIDHRRGILQGAGLVVGTACVAVTAGWCTPALAAIATANTAQSAQDNLIGDDKCVANFAATAASGFLPLGINTGARMLPSGLDEAGRVVTSSMALVGSQASAIDTCGGG